MCLEEEIYRLVKLNKDLIITSFKNQGYKILYLADKLVEIFGGGYEEFIKTQLTDANKNEQIAILTVFKGQEIVELERKFPNADVYVMSEEYNRMESRLEITTEETVSHYLSIFGYGGICFAGKGPIINELRLLSESLPKNDSCHKVLHVTEYMDTRMEQIPQEYYNCGMRDVLYELKEFAAFPEEIRQELNYPENSETLRNGQSKSSEEMAGELSLQIKHRCPSGLLINMVWDSGWMM